MCAAPDSVVHEKRSQMRRSSTAIEPQWEGPTGASGPLDAILVVRTLATMRERIRQREWLIKSRWTRMEEGIARDRPRPLAASLCHTNLRPNSCSVPLGAMPLQCWVTRVSQSPLVHRVYGKICAFSACSVINCTFQIPFIHTFLY